MISSARMRDEKAFTFNIDSRGPSSREREGEEKHSTNVLSRCYRNARDLAFLPPPSSIERFDQPMCTSSVRQCPSLAARRRQSSLMSNRRHVRLFASSLLLIILMRMPSPADGKGLFLARKLEKDSHLQSNQQVGGAATIPGTIWTQFQCDSKISPFLGVGFGCYCPGAWCSNNGQCCSQMCFKKTCY